MKDFTKVAAEIVYDNQPAGGKEAFTALRATVRVYHTESGFTYRTETFTDSPTNAKVLEDFVVHLAKDWLNEIVFFLSVIPEPVIIPYKNPVLCAPRPAHDKGKKKI